MEKPLITRLPITRLPMVFLLQRRTAVEHVEQSRALARWRARETRIPVSDQHAQLIA